MDPYLKASPDLQCGAVDSAAGYLWECQRFRGHDGSHAAEPGPGETVAWPSTGTDRTASIVGAPVTPGELQQRDHWAAEEAQESRRVAADMAVRALVPLAGAYRDVKDYGEDIIYLAGRFRAYIRNGDE